MLAGEPFSRAAKPRVNLVHDQQRFFLIAQPPQHGQEFRRRDIDATAPLNGLDQNRADLAAAEQPVDLRLDLPQAASATTPTRAVAQISNLPYRRFAICWPRPRRLCDAGKRNKIAKLPKLRPKGRPEMVPMRHIERAVPQTMIRPRESNHARPARRPP